MLGVLISQSLKKITGKNAKFSQNLRENCAEKSAENRRKIARKLRVNVLWLRRKVFDGFV